MTDMKIAALENRCLLRLQGADVHDFLQNLITNDMDQVTDTRAIYGALLTAQGKFLHDFIILKSGEAYLLDCAVDRKDDLVRRLTLYKLRADVTLTESDRNIAALFGEGALSAAGLETAGEVTTRDETLLYVDPRLAALGVRIIADPDTYLAALVEGAEMVPYEAYDRHRLAHGIPDGGTDIIPEKNFLLEANFEELNGVSFTKGCYVGQELTARTKHRAKIRKRLLRFECPASLKPGDTVLSGSQEIAEIRSSVETATGSEGLALARIASLVDGDVLETEPAGVVFTNPSYLAPLVTEPS